MPKEISRCNQLQLEVYRDTTSWQDVVSVRMPFKNGELLDFHVRVDPDYPGRMVVQIPDNIYVLHVRGHDEEGVDDEDSI